MKDLSHHIRHMQKKVIKQARQEKAKNRPVRGLVKKFRKRKKVDVEESLTISHGKKRPIMRQPGRTF